MRMPLWLRCLRGATWALLPVLWGIAGCGKDSLVGGTCRAGLTECSLQCIDTDEDPNNCGRCDHSCASGLICFAGNCSDEGSLFRDGSTSDTMADTGDASLDSVDLDTSIDGGPDDSSTSDAATDGSVDDGSDGPTCLPPFNTVDHCGDCTTACADPTPVCGLEGTYKCLAQCELPLEPCGQVCVDKFSDELNCGACGHVCASGICQAGVCVGSGFGHEIVIGMDYSDATLSQSSAQVVLLANAVLLTDRASVRVLTYDQYADPAAVTKINSGLTAAATAKGRSIAFTTAGAFTTIPAQLAVATYDVFLVYEQPLAPDGAMATTGTLWNGAIDGFAKGGGVVVALDAGSAGHMRDLLTNAGLLAVSGETDVSGTTLHVDAPTDVVGVSLPDVFLAKRTSASFTTSQAPDNHHVFVVKDAQGLPSVVHSVP